MYVIPQPAEWTKKQGSYLISYKQEIVLDPSCARKAFRYAEWLNDDLEEYLGYRLLVTAGKQKERGICLKQTAGLDAQEYRLAVDENGICVEGGSGAGLLYGIQTLRQLISQRGAFIPFMEIKDAPEILNRGYYFDVTRGRIPTLDYLKKLADKLSYYKINQLQLYVEHSFMFRDFSEVWRDDTPLTPEEILELDAYCLEREIELIPSLSCFGHLYKVLSTGKYAHLCELEDSDKTPFSFRDRMHHHTLDISNPESLTFVKKMIDEFLPLFSSDHFNLCGDETFDLGKGKSKKLADKIGVDGMYIRFVGSICEYLIEKGKIPMFWGDIICGFPEAVKKLPEGVICLNWGYAPDQSEESSRKLYEAGAVQYSCPGVAGWNQFVNLIRDSYENIKRMCSYAKKYQAIGVLNTDWGDYGHINHPEFSVMGLIYGAAFSWNTQLSSFEEINAGISALEFLDGSGKFVSILPQIQEHRSFQWEMFVNYMEMRQRKEPEEEIKKYFLDFYTGKAKEDNEALLEITKRLYKQLSFVGEKKRYLVKAYVIAIEGISLLNAVGAAIAHREYETGEECMDAVLLAEKLEKWFYHYKELWRSVSRESELYRISHIIISYADYLRSL